jgi:KRAB domain-containing zinc finger protein
MICREVLKSANSAKRHHVQIHHEGKVLVRSCLDCKLDYKLFEDFKRHIEDTHEFERSQFVCMVCGLLLHSSIELSIHAKLHRAVPESDKKLFCDLCNFRGKQKVTIEAHMVTQHGALKKNYHATCEVCGVTYSCYQSFYSHQMTHLDPSERKFKCNFCDKSFTKPALWRDHERIHTHPEGESC